MPYIYAKIKEAISEEAKRFECISRRYELSYCILLLWFEAGEDITQILTTNTRCADRVVKIDDHLYGLIFFANRPDSHAVVANKILYILEHKFPRSKISIGVACSESAESMDLIGNAIQNLLAAKEQDFNTIEDNS